MPCGSARLASLARRSLALLAATAALALAGPSPVHAQSSLTEVSLAILAPTAAEWPLFIAEQQGFYKEEGLKVGVVQMGSPPAVINAIATNNVNLAEDGCDSVIAAVGRGLPIKIIAPIFGTNPYSLVTVPSVRSWADLKGKSVVLGTKQDVTAIALENMAAAQHLTMNDFTIVVGGNSTARYAALQSGNVQAAMLAQPFDLLAEAKGDHRLGSAHDTIKDWDFTCLTVNPAWGNANRATVAKFLRAMRKAIQYGYANRQTAINDLVTATHTDAAIAAKAYDIDFTQWRAFDPSLKISQSALENVGRYQIKFGAIKAMPPFGTLYDPSFLAEATR